MSANSSMNVMLGVHEKKTTATDVHRPIRTYISQYYSERDAISAEDDLQQIQTLRTHIHNSNSTLDVRRGYITSYFKSLTLMETRFPLLSISFTWYDAFKNNKKATLSSIQFEKCAILFNLGAVYSQIALGVDRGTVLGIKVACNAFQSAAGAFGYLKGMVIGLSDATVDLSTECVGMLEKMMLAQAQECFFEKAIGDRKPNGICSKVARQVGLYYDEAFASLNSAPLNQHFDKAWVSRVQLKSAHFYAEACYRYSLELHNKEEIAEEIARLKIGLSALTDAMKSAKGVTAPLLDATSKLEGNMKRNLERAMKENERVYLQRIPASGSLLSLPAASLVKPVNMAELLDASKEKHFTGIIPDASAKALSKYTEMVDDIIRTQAEKMQQGSEIAKVRLKEMDLPDSILALEGTCCLPSDLKKDVEAIQISGGPAGLQTELQKLYDLRGVYEEHLVLIRKQGSADTQFRAEFGTNWTRPQSSTLTKNRRDRLIRLAQHLKKAADWEAKIEKVLTHDSAFMEILDQRPIESALPTLGRPMVSLDSSEKAIVGALKQSLMQLEVLGTQRAVLEDMLKEMKKKDDILPKLMASRDSPDDLFRKELTKYDHICEEIAQNIEAQENLFLQIHTRNEEFAKVFNMEDYKVSRDKCYEQITAAIAKYKKNKNYINEGFKFYPVHKDLIKKVMQQRSDSIMRRNMETDGMVEEVEQKMADLNFKQYYDYGAAFPVPSGLDCPTSIYDPFQPSALSPYVLYQSAYEQPSYPAWPGPYPAPTPPSYHAAPPSQSGHYWYL